MAKVTTKVLEYDTTRGIVVTIPTDAKTSPAARQDAPYRGGRKH